MKCPPKPTTEPSRLARLEELDVLDTLAEERFDRITRLAKALFDVPIALVSLVDDDRQWFKSRQGLTACSTPRDVSFCGHAILQHEVFLVEDAFQDERFHDNPLVTGPPNVRFYAGYPLQDQNGLCLGTLCVIDHQPRSFPVREQLLLADLGQVAERELVSQDPGRKKLEVAQPTREQRREHLDATTGVWNEEGMRLVLRLGLGTCSEQAWPATVLRVELDENKELSETWSQQGSDIILAEVAQVLRGCVREYDAIGRTGEQGFLVLLAGLSPIDAAARVAFFRQRLEQNPVLEAIGVRLRLGYACVGPTHEPADLEALLEQASQPLDLDPPGSLRSAS